MWPSWSLWVPAVRNSSDPACSVTKRLFSTFAGDRATPLMQPESRIDVWLCPWFTMPPFVWMGVFHYESEAWGAIDLASLLQPDAHWQEQLVVCVWPSENSNCVLKWCWMMMMMCFLCRSANTDASSVVKIDMISFGAVNVKCKPISRTSGVGPGTCGLSVLYKKFMTIVGGQTSFSMHCSRHTAVPWSCTGAWFWLHPTKLQPWNWGILFFLQRCLKCLFIFNHRLIKAPFGGWLMLL